MAVKHSSLIRQEFMTHACYCVTKHNAPLERMDCPTPEPKGAEVLVRMTAAGVCHSDIHVWEGVYDLGSGNKMTLKDRGIILPLRVFMAVDERPAVARRELERWFTEVYHNPPGTDASGIHGTPEQVRERLEDLVAHGADHLLLNPVCRHAEQLEALAAIVGLT